MQFLLISSQNPIALNVHKIVVPHLESMLIPLQILHNNIVENVTAYAQRVLTLRLLFLIAFAN